MRIDKIMAEMKRQNEAVERALEPMRDMEASIREAMRPFEEIGKALRAAVALPPQVKGLRVHSQRGIATYEKRVAEQDAQASAAEEMDSDNDLDLVTTRELLEELRLRGDLAMVAMPTTSRGADGSVLSAMATSQLRSLEAETLEAVRGA